MTDQKIPFKIKRQDKPGSPSYWQNFQVPYKPFANIISCLMEIQRNPNTQGGKTVAPVTWDSNCLEEVCGACTMVINGRVRQACSAIVDRLLEDDPKQIELRPMSKFPVVRDLSVDRSRMFNALSRVKAWVNADSYYDLGPGPRVSRSEQEQIYPEHKAEARDLQGWLELPWEDAPHLVVAGMNDGFVPDSLQGHAYLPDGARRLLGLRHNETRHARDA